MHPEFSSTVIPHQNPKHKLVLFTLLFVNNAIVNKHCEASTWLKLYIGCSGLRLEASLQIQVQSRAVLQPAATGRPMRRHTIDPASSEIGKGLACWDVLVPLRSSDSLWWPGTYTLTLVASCTVSSDTLVGWLRC